MSKTIIENYLPKVGNSYYKSLEFYQEQARTWFKFTLHCPSLGLDYCLVS